MVGVRTCLIYGDRSEIRGFCLMHELLVVETIRGCACIVVFATILRVVVGRSDELA